MASSRARTTTAPCFAKTLRPCAADIADVAARVEERMQRWLSRRDLVNERAAEDRSKSATSPSTR
jgi:hypothetical protein